MWEKRYWWLTVGGTWRSTAEWCENPWVLQGERRNSVRSYSRAPCSWFRFFLVPVPPALELPEYSKAPHFTLTRSHKECGGAWSAMNPPGASYTEISVVCPTSLSGSASLLYGIYLTSFLAAANVDWNAWNYWVFTMPLGGDFKLNIMFYLVCGATEDFKSSRIKPYQNQDYRVCCEILK